MDKPQAGLREQSASQLSLISPCPPPQARSFPVASGRPPLHSFPSRERIGPENGDILNFPMSRWWGWQERRSPEARGDPPRLGQEGKQKLTESAREFPKAFRLAEPVRVVRGNEKGRVQVLSGGRIFLRSSISGWSSCVTESHTISSSTFMNRAQSYSASLRWHPMEFAGAVRGTAKKLGERLRQSPE